MWNPAPCGPSVDQWGWALCELPSDTNIAPVTAQRIGEMARHLTRAVFVVMAAFLVGCGPSDERAEFRGHMAAESPPARRLAEPPARLTEQSGLDGYLAYAAVNNPALEAAFNDWRAAVERVPQVGALPDPRFTYRYFIENVETRVGAQKQSFELAQTFPWLGKLKLRSDAAAAAAAAAEQRFQARKLELFRQVKDAYYEYYYLRRAVAIVGENRDLAKHFESVARTRYKVAAGSHPDVIRAQVELGKLEDRLRTLEELRGPVVARLNAAMNRPPDADLPWPAAIEQQTVAADYDQLLAWLVESNPQLKGMDSEIAASEHQVELARSDYVPDVTLGVGYIDTAKSAGGRHPSDDGQDPVIAMASVNLPLWWNKLAAGVREARSRRQAAIRRKADKINTLGADLKLVLYKLRDAERRIDLYADTLLPKATESLKATETAFRTGKASFSDLVDAQRVLLEFQLAYERSLADSQQHLAELEMIVGKEIPLHRQPQDQPTQ